MGRSRPRFYNKPTDDASRPTVNGPGNLVSLRGWGRTVTLCALCGRSRDWCDKAVTRFFISPWTGAIIERKAEASGPAPGWAGTNVDHPRQQLLRLGWVRRAMGTSAPPAVLATLTAQFRLDLEWILLVSVLVGLILLGVFVIVRFKRWQAEQQTPGSPNAARRFSRPHGTGPSRTAGV